MIKLVSTLKSLWKYYWIVQLVVIAVLSFLLRKETSKVNGFQSIYQASQQDLVKWKDEAGKNRARAEIAELDARNVKHVLEADLKKAIEREVGNLKRNLISYSSVTASTKGSVAGNTSDTVYVLRDRPSLPAKTISIKQPDLSFQGIYVPSLDTLMVTYQVRHNFDIFYYYRKPGKKPFNLFRRKQAVAEIKFDNPGSQTDSLFTMVLERRKSFLGRLF